MIQPECIKKCGIRTDTGGICRICLNRNILQGDVIEQLKNIPDDVMDCVISSPPYWGLRDYGVKGQLGLEPNFRDYLKKMQEIMREIKRVLKNTGTCWINLGDTYAGGNAHSDWSGCTPEFMGRNKETKQKFKAGVKNHLTAKSRYGIPERFYINCIDDGWIARNHIPWYKSNSMPSSVKDRFTNKWESVFFFAKNQKYYFNLDAVREKSITESKPFNLRVRENITGHTQAKLGDKSYTATKEEMEKYNKDGTKRYTDEKLGHRNGLGASTLDKKQDSTLGADGKPIPTYAGFNDRWRKKQQNEPDNKYRLVNRIKDARDDGLDHDHCLDHPKGKNPGDVFFINPKPFAEAHFATFPIDLPLKILKCACPQQVCSKCGIPRYPINKRIGESTMQWSTRKSFASYPNEKREKPQELMKHGVFETIGYSKCDCNESFKPGIVLDPFFGAGTVGIAAEKLGLNWCGIELSKKYITLAEKRLEPFRSEKLEAFT